jgi:hypothetical protein
MPRSNEMPRKPAWWGDDLNGADSGRRSMIRVSERRPTAAEDEGSSSGLWSQYLDQGVEKMEAAAGERAVGDLGTSARIPNDWNFERIQAAFDPSRSTGKTAVFSQDGLDAVYKYQDQVQVSRGGQSEKLGFLVPSSDGSLTYKVPDDFSAYGSRMSDNAGGTPPAGAVYGMHGHIPERDDGFVDAPTSNGGYGDTHSLHRPAPMPMATVARTPDNRGYVVGLHEIDNGRLQFRFPAGSLTREQRRQIQRNLDVEQDKFYK